MIRNNHIALVTLALGACVSTASAQRLLFSTGFTNTAGWVESGAMIFSRSNDQFLATGTYSTYFYTNDPWATYGDAYHPIPTSGPLPDNQTLEARVDLVGVNQNDVWADLHVWGDPYAATYGFFKGPDGLGLLKAWNWATSWSWFFYESRAIKNTNVTLVLALTRRGSSLEINARILDKDNGNAVLFDRLVIDTPGSDPVLPSGAFRGMVSWPDPAGTPPPVSRAPANVCLGVAWLNPTNRPQPAAQVVYDNVEVWQYPSPRPYVIAWGADYNGATFVPFGLSNVVAVAAGGVTSLALRANGTVVAWGLGATNFPSGLSNIVAIVAGSSTAFDIDIAGCHALMLRADGTVVGWGNTTSPGGTIIPAGLSNVVAVAAGAGHSLALRIDGSVIAWGNNDFGQTDVPRDLTNAVAVTAGWCHSVALRADGTVAVWGDPGFGVTNTPPGLSNVVAVAAGFERSLALRSDGTVVAWGRNENGECDVPADVSNAVDVAAGVLHSLALSAHGTVVSWPRGAYAPVATEVPNGLTNVLALAAGAFHSLALIGDGLPLTQARLTRPTVDANGFSVLVPTQSGCVYGLEYKNSLAEAEWTRLPLVAGTGHERTLTDPTASGAQRFYRVRRW